MDPLSEPRPLTPGGLPPEYAFDPGRQWYVVRASFGRAERGARLFQLGGVPTYLPRHIVTVRRDGQRFRQTRLLLPSLLFAYARPDEMADYVGQRSPLAYLSYYYDHFRLNAYGTNPPLTIDYPQMANFIRATLPLSDVRLLTPEHDHYRLGDWVRVVDGPFLGVCGQVTRLFRQQRVAVTLHNFCTVVTAYIPTAFLEPIEPPREK